MKPIFPRQLIRHLTPTSFKLVAPDRIGSVLNIAMEKAADDLQQQNLRRRALDRRCGVDRRSRQHAVLMDMRSPHARRKQRQRRWLDDIDSAQGGIGIDVYS